MSFRLPAIAALSKALRPAAKARFPRWARSTRFTRAFGVFCTAAFCLGLINCHSPQVRATPSIQFTVIPEAGPGGPARTERIAGRVIGAKAGQRIVLFARSGSWWVQPFSSRPFTAIRPDATWEAATHMGNEYAALLVEPTFRAPGRTDVLPGKGASVVAVAIVEGKPSRLSQTLPPKTIRFSGYEWEVLQMPSDSGGVLHANSASNVWTDGRGRLHLRIAREQGQWTCAEIALTRSLGYGSYSFVVHEMPPLEPGTVLGMFTWDPLESGQNNREMDVELSQWGDPGAKNAQFAIQPYYVPANVFRFNAPAAPATHSFDWEPGRVSFRTAQDGPRRRSRAVVSHVFTSGIPSPGGERVHINLYIFGKSRTPQQRGVEVVIEKFEYLP